MAISHSLDGHQCWPEGKFWTWSIGGLFYGVGNNRGLGDRYRVGHGHIKETIFICMYVFHSPSTNFLCVYIHNKTRRRRRRKGRTEEEQRKNRGEGNCSAKFGSSFHFSSSKLKAEEEEEEEGRRGGAPIVGSWFGSDAQEG